MTNYLRGTVGCRDLGQHSSTLTVPFSAKSQWWGQRQFFNAFQSSGELKSSSKGKQEWSISKDCERTERVKHHELRRQQALDDLQLCLVLQRTPWSQRHRTGWIELKRPRRQRAPGDALQHQVGNCSHTQNPPQSQRALGSLLGGSLG